MHRKPSSVYLLYLCRYDSPGRHVEAQDILHFGQHVFVHLMRQVADGEQQVLYLLVRGITAQDHVSRRSANVLLIDAQVLMVHAIQCLFHLRKTRKTEHQSQMFDETTVMMPKCL